jgi:hypothetical protein
LKFRLFNSSLAGARDGATAREQASAAKRKTRLKDMTERIECLNQRQNSGHTGTGS